MFAVIGDEAAVKHDDSVSRHERRQTMRHHDNGPPRGNSGEIRLDDRLALGIERRWPRPRSGSAAGAAGRGRSKCAAAARPTGCTALLEDRYHSPAANSDEFVRARHRRGVHDILEAGGGLRRGDIVPDAAAEQKACGVTTPFWLRKYRRSMSRISWPSMRMAPSSWDTCRDQPGRRGLARTAAADDAEHGARRYLQ